MLVLCYIVHVKIEKRLRQKRRDPSLLILKLHAVSLVDLLVEWLQYLVKLYGNRHVASYH